MIEKSKNKKGKRKVHKIVEKKRGLNDYAVRLSLFDFQVKFRGSFISCFRGRKDI